MLNYVAFYLISFLLKTQGALQAPGSTTPEVAGRRGRPPCTRTLSDLLGVGSYSLHLGFRVRRSSPPIWVWYLLNRSSMGFRFRAVGENPNAARVAGIDVKRVYVVAMLLSGGLVGLAGVAAGAGYGHHRLRCRASTRASGSTRSPSPCSAARVRWGRVRRGHPVRRPSRPVATRCRPARASRSTSCSSCSRSSCC